MQLSDQSLLWAPIVWQSFTITTLPTRDDYDWVHLEVLRKSSPTTNSVNIGRLRFPKVPYLRPRIVHTYSLDICTMYPVSSTDVLSSYITRLYRNRHYPWGDQPPHYFRFMEPRLGAKCSRGCRPCARLRFQLPVTTLDFLRQRQRSSLSKTL